MWVEFVARSRLAQSVFIRALWFPPSTKTNIYRLNFDQDRELIWKTAKADVTSSRFVYLFIYPFIYLSLYLFIYLVLSSSYTFKMLSCHILIKLSFFVGGFTEEHPCIQSFWRVVSQFTDTQKRQLLKFVTSCSRPPLLGFKVRSVAKRGRLTIRFFHSLCYSLAP